MHVLHEMKSSKPAPANGGALAAMVAAGAGSAVMGIVYTGATAVPAVGRFLTWYQPAGALSGMCAVTVLAWLLLWFTLDRLWCSQGLRAGPVLLVAFGSLLFGVLLTFPPVARLF